jgi:tetratricopeptide (TPR) repeat protein
MDVHASTTWSAMIRQRNLGFVRLVMVFGLGVCLVGLAEIWAASTGAAADQPSDLDARVTELIAALGSEEYAVRERAQEQLGELGLLAFDALLEASRHDDVEIAMRARYLVGSLPIEWSTVNDSTTVRSILRNYSAASRAERNTRMQQLAALADSSGIPALCRLARFEVDTLLSKEAGLFALNHEAPTDSEQRSELAERIRTTVGLSARTAPGWLRAYAASLVAPGSSTESWAQLVEAEQQTFARFPSRTNRRIVRDLFRWQADLLRQLDRPNEFHQAVRSSLEYVEGNRRELLDFVDWALEREAWIVVDDVAARFSHEFNRHAALVYLLAEAQLKRGNGDLADGTARRALAISPDNPDAHAISADELQLRLMYDWAEREYRLVIGLTKPSTNNGLHLNSRIVLADMLYDLQRESDAAEEMAGVVAVIDKNEKILESTRRTVAELTSLLEYYRAMHFKGLGELEKQVEHLERAYEIYPLNPDFLIAMYHVPNPKPPWRKLVEQRISTAQKTLGQQIERAESEIKTGGNGARRPGSIEELAPSLNELAWLIANTEGDFTSAVQYSQRSLKLKPDEPAYLDTLARCYFAVGDLENAVKHQALAVEGAPYYQQIRRQLKLFEDALAKAAEKN